MVIIQVCLLSNILNCRDKFVFISLGDNDFMRKTVDPITAGKTNHFTHVYCLKVSMKYKPIAAVTKLISSNQAIRPIETNGDFRLGVTFFVLILFKPVHPKKANGINHSIHTQPALASHVSDPAMIRLKMVPLLLFKIIEPPLNAPSIGNLMTKGIRICMVVTPKFPSPAFIPNAYPCIRFGKKKLILLMDDAKFPPPNPDKKANI